MKHHQGYIGGYGHLQLTNLSKEMENIKSSLLAKIPISFLYQQWSEDGHHGNRRGCRKQPLKFFSFGKQTCLLTGAIKNNTKTPPQACKSLGLGREQSSELGASEKQAHRHFQEQLCSPPIFNFGAQPFTHSTLHPRCGCPTKMVKHDSENRDDSNSHEEILHLNTDWNCPKGKKTVSYCWLGTAKTV